MTPAQIFARAGQALFGSGQDWKAQFGRALMIKPDSVDAMTKEKSRIPPGLWTDIAALIQDRALELPTLRSRILDIILPLHSEPSTDGKREIPNANFLKTRTGTFAISRNLLRNFVIRDAPSINSSFDKHYWLQLEKTDELLSDAAFINYVATKTDIGLHDHYKTVLTGLLTTALNTFSAAVVLVRNGLHTQSMPLIRQVVEICSTVLHLISDPEDQAIKKFQEGKYDSTSSISRAKKAVPIIGMFWGFLSNTFVHINQSHSEVQRIRPYKTNDPDVGAVLTCLRMAAWIVYITAEAAFPTAQDHNRYWKIRPIDGGKNAVAYDPDEDERQWASEFLNLDGIGPDDLTSA